MRGDTWPRGAIALRVKPGAFTCAGGQRHTGAASPAAGEVHNVFGSPTGCGCEVLDFGNGRHGVAARYALLCASVSQTDAA